MRSSVPPNKQKHHHHHHKRRHIKARLKALLHGKAISASTYLRFQRQAILLATAPTNTMAPIVHCVRHAQGYHNLSVANHVLPDPLLTKYGEEQCCDLAKKFPFHSNVEAVVASPIKRTVYTALIAFGQDLQSKGLKVVALPELQETSDLPCDTGSSPEELAREFEGKPVDLGLVTPGWNSKQGKFAPTSKAIEGRARDARRWLMERPEKEIVVVFHGKPTTRLSLLRQLP